MREGIIVSDRRMKDETHRKKSCADTKQYNCWPTQERSVLLRRSLLSRFALLWNPSKRVARTSPSTRTLDENAAHHEVFNISSGSCIPARPSRNQQYLQKPRHRGLESASAVCRCSQNITRCVTVAFQRCHPSSVLVTPKTKNSLLALHKKRRESDFFLTRGAGNQQIPQSSPRQQHPTFIHLNQLLPLSREMPTVTEI